MYVAVKGGERAIEGTRAKGRKETLSVPALDETSW